MRKENDFSKVKKNPFAALLKKQITLRSTEEVVEYFKSVR